MRILRSRLAVFALWVVVCQSATLLAAPLALCGASRAETQGTSSSVDADCPCGDETGTCPMHHKSTKTDRPAPSAPARGKAYCSGCSDPSDVALLLMTSLAAPVITSFDLTAPQPEAAISVLSSTSFAPVDRRPSAPPPRV